MPVSDSFGGYTFADPALLIQALTHRSVGARNNERQEFLGDAMLNFIAAEALYRRWQRADEGALTRARAELVRESSLARLARRLGLGERLILGPGEMKSGGHRRDSILADGIEAVVAAVYVDAGFERCREVLLGWLEPEIAALPVGKVQKDPKTRLQEWLQGRSRHPPTYALVDTRGEDHAKVFQVSCTLADTNEEHMGEGQSRRQAEQNAAQAMLTRLGVGHD